MADEKITKAPNAWIAVDLGLGIDHRLAPYILILKGERTRYQAIKEDDWVLVLNPAGTITRVGRVLRVRSDLESTTLYFDRVFWVSEPVQIGVTSLSPPASGNIGRVQWTDFTAALSKALNKTIAEVLPVQVTPVPAGALLHPRAAATGRDGRSARSGRRTS